jgi:hypothetical protein
MVQITRENFVLLALIFMALWWFTDFWWAAGIFIFFALYSE